MRDKRIDKLADVLVNFSVNLQKGEKIFIEATDVPEEVVCAVLDQVYKVGGVPYVKYGAGKIQRSLLMGADEGSIKTLAKYEKYIMEDMDAYIGIRGFKNNYELSDVPAETSAIYQRDFFYPVHHEVRVAKTKWVILRYPTDSMAQLSEMSAEKFEDFFFDVCTLDYAKMSRAMDALVELMNGTDKVRITAKDTDLTFSIKGIPAIKCAGNMNIPDGEVYTAPVKNCVNGKITYNAPSMQGGKKYENISLTFKDGKIIKAECSGDNCALNEIFDTDEGARYVGEFAIGVNPYVTKPMLDTLFDEKITGSIHFTPGCCYEDAYNGNQSGVHWDLVLIQTPEYGGGEIWFDDVLIRKDGVFLPDSLKPLNAENLK
ncbi:MAG: aminopeptidase [Clostridia bacterium]|nr:aminopeptidase [Clostridia bacterium]